MDLVFGCWPKCKCANKLSWFESSCRKLVWKMLWILVWKFLGANTPFLQHIRTEKFPPGIHTKIHTGVHTLFVAGKQPLGAEHSHPIHEFFFAQSIHLFHPHSTLQSFCHECNVIQCPDKLCFKCRRSAETTVPATNLFFAIGTRSGRAPFRVQAKCGNHRNCNQIFFGDNWNNVWPSSGPSAGKVREPP